MTERDLLLGLGFTDSEIDQALSGCGCHLASREEELEPCISHDSPENAERRIWAANNREYTFPIGPTFLEREPQDEPNDPDAYGRSLAAGSMP